MFHMKCQALISLENNNNKKKKSECYLLLLWLALYGSSVKGLWKTFRWQRSVKYWFECIQGTRYAVIWENKRLIVSYYPQKRVQLKEKGLNAICRQQKPISARHWALLCSSIKFFGIQWFCKHGGLWECAKCVHYENTPIQIHWKFYHQKMAIYHIKNRIFFIFLLKT